MMAQNAIITNKLVSIAPTTLSPLFLNHDLRLLQVLHGTIDLTTGGTTTLILIHTPAAPIGTEPQIAIARYTTAPNLSTLPGVPLSSPANSGSAPAPGTWGLHPPSTLPVVPPSMFPTGMAGAVPGIQFVNPSIGGNTVAVGRGPRFATTSRPGPMITATGIPGGNNQQQLVNSLMNIGGANMLNSFGGANNLDINTLMKNPELVAHLARYRQPQQQQQQQQQMGLGMSTGGVMGNSGIVNGAANANGLASTAISSAALLDRITSQALDRNPNAGAPGNNAFGSAAASALARQQFLNSLSAHSTAVGAMNANNAAANNVSNPGFNQGNTLGYSLGGGITRPGGPTGIQNLGMNTTMGATDGDLLRRVGAFANQRRISQQDALRAIMNFGMSVQQQQGWNSGASGSGG